MKPKLFLWGACDLEYSVNIDIIRNHFELNLFANSNFSLEMSVQPNSFFYNDGVAPSYTSLYLGNNEIAANVHDSLSSTPIKITHNHLRIYKEILKFPYFEYFKNNVSDQDYLILSFSTELYTKVFTKKNKFTLFPFMDMLKNPADPLHWLYKDFISKPEFHLAFDSPTCLNLSNDILQDFARDLYSIFGNRIIIVKTHLTNLVYCEKLGSVSKIEISCDNDIPFYSTSRIILHNNDHNYAARIATMIIKQFKKCISDDIPVIELTQPVFLDLNHAHGYAPFHLHKFSSYKIGLLIYNELMLQIEKKKNERVE